MKITIDDVARELEITPENVRLKIDSGELPIAIVGGTDRRKSYTVLPSKLYEATGIKLGGYEPPAVCEVDYEKLAETVLKKLKEAI